MKNRTEALTGKLMANKIPDSRFYYKTAIGSKERYNLGSM